MESVGVLTGIGVKAALAVVLALGATAAVRYLHGARQGWRPGGGTLRVRETAALGQNRAVHVVSVGSRAFLIASTPSRVVMLADVTEEQEPVAEQAPANNRSPLEAGRDFASMLAGMLGPAFGKPVQETQVAAEGRADRLLQAARALRRAAAGESLR